MTTQEDPAKRYRLTQMVVDELRSDDGRIDARLVAAKVNWIS